MFLHSLAITAECKRWKRDMLLYGHMLWVTCLAQESLKPYTAYLHLTPAQCLPASKESPNQALGRAIGMWGMSDHAFYKCCLAYYTSFCLYHCRSHMSRLWQRRAVAFIKILTLDSWRLCSQNEIQQHEVTPTEKYDLPIVLPASSLVTMYQALFASRIWVHERSKALEEWPTVYYREE